MLTWGSLAVLWGALGACGAAGPPAGWTRPPREAERGVLVVFVAPEASDVARSFQKESLPAIRNVAHALRIPVRVVDVRDGAPAEVTITPLLIYQDSRGRSIYQGRYTTPNRLRSFLRTSRVVAQGTKPLVKKNIPVWRSGRAVVAAPVKIAPLTGHRPVGYHADAFVASARKEASAGFKRFHFTATAALRRSDRLFYMDFNPWLSPDGRLYLSVALFSQFHCKKPIFARSGDTFSGPWEERTRLFREAAATLETAVAERMAETTAGDGFDPVPETVPTVSWERLGLSLPPPPVEAMVRSSGPPLPRRWIVETQPVDSQPQLMFHFPPPFDGYAGEVRKITGELDLSADLTLDSARGRFIADLDTVTMGDPDLDHALQSSRGFLNVKQFPTSQFLARAIVPESSSSGRARLAYGELIPASMRGTFTAKGVSVPLVVRTMWEPVVNRSGESRLILRGAFQIRLSRFGIEGPDPAEDGSLAHDTLLFDFSLTLKPR